MLPGSSLRKPRTEASIPHSFVRGSEYRDPALVTDALEVRLRVAEARFSVGGRDWGAGAGPGSYSAGAMVFVEVRVEC